MIVPFARDRMLTVRKAYEYMRDIRAWAIHEFGTDGEEDRELR